jgi:hypothetical protein
MPLFKPCGPIASGRQLELRILEQVEWKSGSPGLCNPVHVPLLVLMQISNWLHQYPSVVISKDQELMMVVLAQFDSEGAHCSVGAEAA